MDGSLYGVWCTRPDGSGEWTEEERIGTSWFGTQAKAEVIAEGWRASRNGATRFYRYQALPREDHLEAVKVASDQG